MITLAPISLTIFKTLTTGKGRPSTPHGVNLNVLVTTLNFIVVTMKSINLPVPSTLTSKTRMDLISPALLVGACLILAFTRLLLSPVNVSFMSGITPPGCGKVVVNN